MRTNIDRLRARIERNMEDFKAKTLMLDDESIYEMARRIAAVEDVYFYMTTHDWADESEAAVLLGLGNPLEALADEWEEHLDEQNAAFGVTVRDFINGDFIFTDDWDDDDGDDDYSVYEALDILGEIEESLEILDEIEDQLDELRTELERLAERGIDI